MISISGGSFGLQLGGQSIDVVMLFMTPDSMKHLLKDKVTLGGDAAYCSRSEGPRGIRPRRTPMMRWEILTYARSRGLFTRVFP